MGQFRRFEATATVALLDGNGQKSAAISAPLPQCCGQPSDLPAASARTTARTGSPVVLVTPFVGDDVPGYQHLVAFVELGDDRVGGLAEGSDDLARGAYNRPLFEAPLVEQVLNLDPPMRLRPRRRTPASAADNRDWHPQEDW